MNIEIEEDALAELLEHAMTGMQEIREFTPTMIATYKELATKLPNDCKTIKEFAASLQDPGEEDYSFLIGDDDDDEYY